MYQNIHESQNIKWSMVVLFLSLVLVYIILYYAKWDLWKNDGVANVSHSVDSSINSDLVISDILDTWEELIVDKKNHKDKNKEVIVEVPSNELNSENISDKKNEKKTNMKELEDWDMIILSWTKTYYGKLDFVSKLWISYKYALRDEKNIYYLNMWDYDYDFSDIARKLKWSLYVMNTTQELIANGLFGEKVTFINIPEYKNQKVLILLEVNNGSWLLAIDYSIYHQVKPYLKTLFID